MDGAPPSAARVDGPPRKTSESILPPLSPRPLPPQGAAAFPSPAPRPPGGGGAHTHTGSLSLDGLAPHEGGREEAILQTEADGAPRGNRRSLSETFEDVPSLSTPTLRPLPPQEFLKDYQVTRCCSRNKLIREKNDFPVAASLSNPENWICFLNCILQCVVHTVPLVSKLLKVRHLGQCPSGSDEFCCYCSLKHHASEVITLSGDVLYPRKFVERLKLTFQDFKRGQHQDAHEFLKFLLDKLGGVSVAPRSESEEPTSIVKEIFGGQLKSQLRCPNCNHCSDRLESFLELNLEINKMDTLMDSLSSYTKVEVVEDSICVGCKSRVNLEKHLKVEQAPEVLVIQLKRFQNLGSVISKIYDMVKYQLELDLSPFMSSPDEKPQDYDLYGVVEHMGSTAYGHYVCYIRSSPTDWFCFDDEKVVEITEDALLEKEVYLLFYVKRGSSPWFSTLLEKKEMLLSDYLQEVAENELVEDGIPKAGSFSITGTDSDERDIWGLCFEGAAEKNEAGPCSQGNANGTTLCSVPDKNKVCCSIGGGPSGSGETQEPASLPWSLFVEDAMAFMRRSMETATTSSSEHTFPQEKEKKKAQYKLSSIRTQFCPDACPEDWNNFCEIQKKLDLSSGSEAVEYFTQIEKDANKVVRTMHARKLVPVRDALVQELQGLIASVSQLSTKAFFEDKILQTKAIDAQIWLDNKVLKQSSLQLYEQPVLTCGGLQKWIDNLSEETAPESTAYRNFKPENVEKLYFNPDRGSFSVFIDYLRDRLCDHDQHHTFEYQGESCRLLEYQTSGQEQPPRWMLIQLIKDGSKAGIYMRSDSLYIDAFSNHCGKVYELVLSEEVRLIKDSEVFGRDRSYPSLLNYERGKPLPAEVSKARMFEIILTSNKFSDGIKVLSGFNHEDLAKMSPAEKEALLKSVQESLVRNAVVLAEVGRTVDHFIHVNSNWRKYRSTLTELLFQYMMNWKVMSDKVRSGLNDAPFKDVLWDKILMKFRHEAMRVLALVCNSQGPGIIKRPTSPGDNGNGPEDPGQSGDDDEELDSYASGTTGGNGKGSEDRPSGGDDDEQGTAAPETSAHCHGKNKGTNVPGSGPDPHNSDCCHQSPVGGGDGGRDNKRSSLGISEMVLQITMALMAILITSKRYDQSLIKEDGLELQNQNISQRRVEQLGAVWMLPTAALPISNMRPKNWLGSKISVEIQTPTKPFSQRQNFGRAGVGCLPNRPFMRPVSSYCLRLEHGLGLGQMLPEQRCTETVNARTVGPAMRPVSSNCLRLKQGTGLGQVLPEHGLGLGQMLPQHVLRLGQMLPEHGLGLGQVLPEQRYLETSNIGRVGPVIQPDLCSRPEHGSCLDQKIPVNTVSSADSVAKNHTYLGLEFLLEQLFCSKIAYDDPTESSRTSLHGEDPSDVLGLLFGSQASLIGSSVDEVTGNLKETIPSEPFISRGQTLLEIFSVQTNLPLINYITLWDDVGGTLIYKHKEGEKERFIKDRSYYLSSTGEQNSDYIVSVLLSGPNRPMSANAIHWVLEMDVPVESSLHPETCEGKEIPGRVFKKRLHLSDYVLDKPRSNFVFVRGGFLKLTSIVYNNAVCCSISIELHFRIGGPCPKRVQVLGQLEIFPENCTLGFTIFQKTDKDLEQFHCPELILNGSRLGFELPLTRDILALPIGPELCVKGTLRLGPQLFSVCEKVVLNKDVVQVEFRTCNCMAECKCASGTISIRTNCAF